MSALKTEIRKAVIDDLVASLEETRDAAEVSSVELRGGKVGVDACMKVVSSLMAVVKGQFDSGDLSMENADLIRRYLNRAIGGFAQVSREATTRSLEKKGLAEGFEVVIAKYNKLSAKCQVELDERATANANALDAGLESVADVRSAPRSLKEQRNDDEPVTAEALEEFAGEEGIEDFSSQLKELIESEYVSDTR